MKMSILAALTAMLAASQAAPTSENEAASPVLEARKNKHVNDCGPSNFVGQTSGGSPLVKDCQTIAYNIRKGGTFDIPCPGNNQRTYAKYGTCAIGAHCLDDSLNTAHIGNQDTIDLINSSIDKFASGGKVGSFGRMGCQSAKGLAGGVRVEWGIYHT